MLREGALNTRAAGKLDRLSSKSTALRRRRIAGRNGIIAAALVAALLLLPGSAGATQAVLTDDAYTSSAFKAANFGSGQTLAVSAAGRTFLLFDFATLPPVSGSSVEKATLTVFVNSVLAGGHLDVNLPVGPWNEAALTYNLAPPLVASSVASVPVVVADKNSFVTIDVTSIVQGWMDNPASNLGLVLVPAD